MAKTTEELYTTREVAVILKVKEDTVRRWLSESKLGGVRVGRLWRITEGQLKEFLGNNH